MSYAQISERVFTEQVCKSAQWFGWLVYHPRAARTKKSWRTAMIGNIGFPDCVFSRRERLIFAELKAGRGKPSIEQEAWLVSLRSAPVEVYVWKPSDIDEIEKILR